MHSDGAASGAAVSRTSARAEASRRNGATSRGPKTEDGKARSSRNALRHGLRAQRFVVLPDEDARAYAAHEQALMDELAPDGAFQTLLARRVAAAAWRLSRADRVEVELFEHQRRGRGDLGEALIRDGHGARALQTLLRYRGGAQAELWRALHALKALQAEAAQAEAGAQGCATDAPAIEPSAAPAVEAAPAPDERRRTATADVPNEPEAPAEPERRDRGAAAGPAAPAAGATGRARCEPSPACEDAPGASGSSRRARGRQGGSRAPGRASAAGPAAQAERGAGEQAEQEQQRRRDHDRGAGRRVP